MNQKRRHGVNRKLKQEAAIITATSLYTNNISNEINPSRIQWFINVWKNKNNYARTRVDKET